MLCLAFSVAPISVGRTDTNSIISAARVRVSL